MVLLKKVKGNTPFVIQKKGTSTVNAIGEKETTWVDAVSFKGVLGLQSGDHKYSTFNAKIEESTHVLVCDFNEDIYALADQNTRVIAKGKMYDVLLIDNPDELDIHLEINLRFVGGQNVKN